MPKHKTIEDYRELAKTRGGKYESKTIPKRIVHPADGWTCADGHKWKTSYSHIFYGKTWCPGCSGNFRKTLSDYQKLALEKGGKYILDTIPSGAIHNTTIKILGWQCKEGHIWSTTYSIVNSGHWCPECAGVKRKTFKDYQSLAILRGGEYIASAIPKNVLTSSGGWKCAKAHIWSTKYAYISEGSWCPQCWKKSLEDYRAMASQSGGEYILDFIPSDTSQMAVNGWKCGQGHVWSAKYSTIYEGHWCPQCACGLSEQTCREIMEKLLSAPYPTRRLKILDGLELDGYNEEDQLGFEYQGVQHDTYVEFFHRSQENFEKMLERDRRKLILCGEHDIKVVIVPPLYTYRDSTAMEAYVKSELIRLEILLF